MLWFFFQLAKWGKKLFWTNKKFVYFFELKKNLGQNWWQHLMNPLLDCVWVPLLHLYYNKQTKNQKMFKTRKWNKKYFVTFWSNWQNYASHSLKITCKSLAWNIVFSQPFRIWKLFFRRILLQKHVQFFPHARFARNLRSQIH